MTKEEMLWKLEGLHTVETVAEALNIKRQSAINLLSRLKKEGYVTVEKHRKSLYKISMKKQRPRDPGMFDIINKYSPNMKLAPWYDHQVHGAYGPEDALIDAIQTKSIRAILASTRLFSHIRDWPKVYRLAKEKGIWQKVGALYDVARKIIKTRKMSKRFRNLSLPKKNDKFQYIIPSLKSRDFLDVEKIWKVYLPINWVDLEDYKK
jgi:biotin operon repressor